MLESTPDVGSRSLTFGINIEPEFISSFRILSALRRIPKKYRKHIVLEILESSVPDYDKFVKAARFLRKKWVSIWPWTILVLVVQAFD